MKKSLVAIFCIFLLILCNTSLQEKMEYKYEFRNTKLNVIYKKSDNYIIYTNTEQSVFNYIIKDNKNNVIDMGYHDYRGSFDIYENEEKIVLEYGFGGNSWYERYYDVSSVKVSRFFYRPIATSKDMVAYFVKKTDNSTALIIQDIYDPSRFYKEVNRDFSDFVFKDLANAEFILHDQGTKLKINYWINPNDENITEFINLE